MFGNVYIVGLMGSGKTTVARTLAKKLNKKFIDSDQEIEARTGVSISVIFDIEGESSFRRREVAVIADLCRQKNIVLATGGGAILSPETRRTLHSTGTVIYLKASIASILHRTRYDKKRPLLQTSDPKKKLEELEAVRDPLYREVAHHIVETGRPHPNAIVNIILDKFNLSDDRDRSGMATQRNKDYSPNKLSFDLPLNSIQLDLDLGKNAYPILIGSQLIGCTDLFQSTIASKKVVVITNEVVAPLYLTSVERSLEKAGMSVSSMVLPDGEQHKTWQCLMTIFDALLAQHADRKITLIALGGGVIGDMVGFAASIYMRGVTFIQMPTTLLSQVDSSVGGKTGINHPLGKNMIGSFYQPKAVLIDIDTLGSLPQREYLSGLAEVVKHAIILDKDFFSWLVHHVQAVLNRQEDAVKTIIRKSCEIKASVVKRDEKEKNLRAILNFGHTFGHAIEAGLGYGVWTHGEAVACGMAMASQLSYKMQCLDESSYQQIQSLLNAFGFNLQCPYMSDNQWFELMQVDKKNDQGEIKYVLLKGIGEAYISAAPDDVVLSAIRQYSSAQ